MIKGALLLLPSLALTVSAMAVEMNGIKFKDYVGFENKWKLVTARYRTDNRELRFVYANPIAAKAIEAGAKVYPKGAVFAKIAYLAQPDPAFESSLGPSQTRRIQLMVKDPQNYKEHRGWGYALFTHEGKVNPEPEKDQVNACSACHDLVPERDYVFSQAFNRHSLPAQLFQLEHTTVERSVLPSELAAQVPETFAKLLIVKSYLTKNVFQGTLDELKPALARLASTEKKAVVFLSDDKKKFSLVYPEDLSTDCDDEGAKGISLVSVTSLLDGRVNKTQFCQALTR